MSDHGMRSRKQFFVHSPSSPRTRCHITPEFTEKDGSNQWKRDFPAPHFDLSAGGRTSGQLVSTLLIRNS